MRARSPRSHLSFARSHLGLLARLGVRSRRRGSGGARSTARHRPCRCTCGRAARTAAPQSSAPLRIGAGRRSTRACAERRSPRRSAT
eukprot:6967100-Prymnesium_polylepis.1